MRTSRLQQDHRPLRSYIHMHATHALNVYTHVCVCAFIFVCLHTMEFSQPVAYDGRCSLANLCVAWVEGEGNQVDWVVEKPEASPEDTLERRVR